MLPTDIFCRSVIFPNCTNNGRFDKAALLQFSSLKGLSGAVSLAGWDSCGEIDVVHEFGCITTKTKNDRKCANVGRALTEDEQYFYLGYYSFCACYLNLSFLEYTLALLRHAPEDGDDRHFQLELHAADGVTEQKRVKSDERLVRDRIADLLFGPEEYPDNLCCGRQITLKSEIMQILP